VADIKNPQAATSFRFPEIPDIKAILVGELAKRGNWVVANIQTNSYWPVTAQKVMYRGEEVWILPLMNGFFPSVAMMVSHGRSRDHCVRILMRFLSALSWVERQGYLVDGITGGSLPRPMGREKSMGFSLSDEFDLSYFPEPTDERALLALALMREGRALNHPAYAFLSYYRVLEVALPDGKARGKWITDHVDVLRDHQAKDAITKLRAGGAADIGDHLNKTNRQAIAHASKMPIIDPDDPSHGKRLWSEMPIILGLAELAIETLLGVETSFTVYTKHLYELAGFKDIFGPNLVAQIAKGEQLPERALAEIPTLNVQIRRRVPYPPLSNLVSHEVTQEGSIIHLLLQSSDGRGLISFGLDFAGERLLFEVFEDLQYSDDGSAEAAEATAEVKRFVKDYFGNGQLHIYNAQTGALLSRKDAYLPVNMMPNPEGSNQEIAYWCRLAQLRRQRRASVDSEIVQWSAPYFLSVGVTFGSVAGLP
jgi:hypothetical protein